MKIKIFYILFISLLSLRTMASPGDTTRVKVFDKVSLNHNGNFIKWAHLQDTSKHFQKIIMKYTIGCESNGQCEWDYTNTIYVRRHTGIIDSTLNQAPLFKVKNTTPDSFSYCTHPTYSYYFDTISKQTDSALQNSVSIIWYRNKLSPLLATDTQYVWPALYWKYLYSINGTKIDSIWVNADSTIHQSYTPYYTKNERLESYELGRMITPYAKTFPKKFTFIYTYDVTDFALLFKDSSEIIFNYSGYSWGFVCTLDFLFVEGTPIRKVLKNQLTWNGSWTYGNPNKPIETYLPEKKFYVDSPTKSVRFRLTITGHGNESNEGCSEFCSKHIQLKLNGKLLDNRAVWRDRCGQNALINQGGTWTFDRGNWCPGESVETWVYELPIQSDSNTIDLNMDTFTAKGSASYSIGSNLVFYEKNNFSTDVALEEIYSPSENFWYNRINPICNSGKIRIRNLGSQALTQVKINIQIGKNTILNQNWKGNLAFNESQDVVLNNLDFSGINARDTFIVKLINPNNVTDENDLNNQLSSNIIRPLQTPLNFIIETITNNFPEENYLVVKDVFGKIWLSHGFDSANYLYADTLHLPISCYTIDLVDSAGDGLDYWYNRGTSGTGGFRIMKYQPTYGLIKTFNPDFGSFIHCEFTAGGPLSVDENKMPLDFILYPNPCNEICHLQFTSSINRVVNIIDVNGQLLHHLTSSKPNVAIDVSYLSQGVYFIDVIEADSHQIKKWIKY